MKNPRCGWKSFAASIAVTVIVTMMALQITEAQEASIPLIGTCINDSYVQFYQNATIGGTSAEIVIPVTYCPHGCNATVGQYGADCVFTVQCSEKSMAGLGLGSNAELFGLMIAIVGVGICVDSIIGFAEKRGGKVW